MTRVLLLTGKGGVGKTTIAAATAVRAARSGARVLLTSTDPAHSLADVLDQPLGDQPTAVEPRLLGQQLDAQARLESHWGDVRAFLVQVLHATGLGEVQAEELGRAADELVAGGTAPAATLLAMGGLVEHLHARGRRAREAFAERFARFDSREVRAAFRRLATTAEGAS